MNKTIRNISAAIFGFFVAPMVALLVAIITFVAVYFEFWRSLFADMERPIANETELNKEPVGVWEKHIAKLEKKQNKNDGE